jgi:hypothetical protein
MFPALREMAVDAASSDADIANLVSARHRATPLADHHRGGIGFAG